ncbi:DUF72 domain-containing protein [Dongia deserti]|uniref:DUF72 domain-containing protein n=1 Tax=Dongia deserti TaxID=2268030 RepID=UPI0025485B6E|nr:DUF72 domain-containing protein [Dongia deserti]
MFPPAGSHLERYAQRFTAVEINNSFRRPHRQSTYRRWAATVPEGFAFATKAPRTITHDLRLVDAGPALDAFLAQARGLGAKLGPLLFQLPPSLAFDESLHRSFFHTLRAGFDGNVACEPRHRGWFTRRADDLLKEFRIARAAVDPAIVDAAAVPGGWDGLIYFRLHGSPRVYYSEYTEDRLEQLARQLIATCDGQAPIWCIFDNTASGSATVNALGLQARVRNHLP